MQTKTSSRPPIRSRSATASAACAFWRRSTGANSSRRRAWSSRRCATIRPASTRAWISPRATAIATWSSASRGAAAVRSRHRARRRSSWRASGGRRAAATIARAHVGYYLIDDGLPRARTRAVHARGHRRRIGASCRQLAAAALSRRDAAITAVLTAALLAHAHGTAAGARAPGLPACWRCFAAEPVGRGHRQLARDAAGHAAAPAAHGFLAGIPAPSAARWSRCRRMLTSSRCGGRRLLEGSGSPLPRQPRRATPLRSADRFRRRAAGDVAGGRRACCDRRPRAASNALNARIRPRTRHDIFFLLHRPRRWNASEGVWMGYERKRGKLADLNALLRGDGAERFSLIVGDPIALPAVTLRHHARHRHAAAARRRARSWLARIAHPLNRPRFDAAARVVVTDGYGILQPRVGASLPSAARSRYALLVRRRIGHRSVHARRVGRLSGSVRRRLVHRQGHLRRRRVRAGARRIAFPRTASSATICSKAATRARASSATWNCIEEFPVALPRRRAAGAIAGFAATGRSRRGCCRGLPGADGQRERNPLSALSRWKILDNLRRSLVPIGPARAAAARLDRAGRTLAWTLAVIALLVLPALFDSALDLRAASRPTNRSRRHLRRPLARAWPALVADRIHAGVSAFRDVVQSRCNPAHAVAHAHIAAASARMDAIRHWRRIAHRG